MLKIPELPIYNTERYTNFNPISPEDFAQGQIYTNDKLVIYITHLSFNKTAGYLVWDNEGEYVGEEMFSSQNIYAIVTFLNNNNFRLLDYELEVINPLNTNEKILLTPNGTKKIKNTNEEYLRKNISKITEACIKKLVKEGMLNDTDIESDEEGTELSSFEEYTMDYPNDDFDVSDMTPKKLARWCDNIGDFLFVYKGVRGLKVMVANSRKIVDSVIHDLNKCGSIEPTHEVDYLFEKRKNEFVNDYVCIFKIKGSPHGDYYIVYQEDKIHGNRVNLGESRKYLTEAFKSNELRKWFKVHDGVKRVYNDPVYSEIEDKRVYQDGLGDVTDDAILYMEEFYDEKVPSKNGGENHEIKKSFNQAYDKMRQLKMPNRQTRQRSDWDKKAYFTVYQANDGASLLVGIDRNKMDIGSTWGGGEATKKTADRKMRNGWNIKHRTNRYVDDSDTYYYSRKGRDFGISNNHKYKGALKHNQDIKSRMSDDDWKAFQDKRVNSMDSYLKNRYGKGLS